MVNDRVVEQLRIWRDELVNLSRRSNLLYFRHARVSSLEIIDPSPINLLSSLEADVANGLLFSFPLDGEGDEELDSDEISAGQITTTKPSARDLQASLRSLHRSSTQEYLDKGLWTLFLGFGVLRWIDPDDESTVVSPLLLVPATLTRESPREPFRLQLFEGDRVVNPALVLKLTEFGIDLDLDPEDSLDTNLQSIAIRIGDRDGWGIEQRAVLARFSFLKEVMYQDLRQNEALIAEHAVVQAVAAGAGAQDAQFDFAPVDEADLDEKAPPESFPTVLDADSSQRQCIEAASRGASFVMDGPPGTGKSQTIANVIAELLRAGKRVLFVSEKAAALEVVQARLSDVGLSEYLLPLHSQKATRKEVAKVLGDALATRVRPPRSISRTDLATLKDRREQLSHYAAAMNELRHPMEQSLHDVIGHVVALQHLPQAPLPSAIDMSLNPESLAGILDLANALSRAWGPIDRMTEFHWRELAFTDINTNVHQRLRSELAVANETLQGLRVEAEEAASAFRLSSMRSPDDATRLERLAAALEGRPDIPSEWLDPEALGAVCIRIDELRSVAAEYVRNVQTCEQIVGVEWERIDSVSSTEIREAIHLLRSSPQEPLVNESRYQAVECLRRACSEAPAILSNIIEVANRIAQRFALTADDLTIDRAREFAELSGLSSAPRKPIGTWFSPSLFGQIDESIEVLGSLVRSFRKQGEQLRALYEDSVLELDLDGLGARFSSAHRGAGKLRKAYRDDKRLICPHLKARRLTPEAIASLSAASNWQRTMRDIQAQETRHASVLGHYYDGTKTDFEVITDAVLLARRAVQLVGHQFHEDRLRSELADGEAGSADAWIDTSELTTLIDKWDALTSEVVGGFATFAKTQPIESILSLAPDLSSPLALIATGLKEVGEFAQAQPSVNDLDSAMCAYISCGELRDGIADRFRTDRLLLGQLYNGLATDWDHLLEQTEWASRLLSLVGNDMSPYLAQHLMSMEPVTLQHDRLERAVEKWTAGRNAVLANFLSAQGVAIQSELESSFEDGALFLEELEATVGDIDEWFAHVDARQRLETLGFGDQVAFAAQHEITAADVPKVIERSLLERWTDEVITDDPRLRESRSVDRDAIVEEFQSLDRQLFQFASAQVITACNGRRPEVTVGQSAIITREARKRARHMPIRDLLEQTADVTQALKPCFMMSPLTVSQFLKPNLKFDAVIFDEASQVRPCDAINAIYRGDQLIIAGDERQLPPSSFFDRVADDGDDSYVEGQFEQFESILDLCKGQGSFRSLPLCWHYRSQHESLITYSNYFFYGGRLVTFPGAQQDGDDVGLAFYKVDGVYRRGGPRDNPIEAEAVVDRVIFHARTHPDCDLGVVAFSEAQASAIEIALDRRRRTLPELDRFFTDDRLTGFFVKNLENVQGDERDIIIFSIGYGFDESSKFTLNFGPINNPGGERRLNVAITRARRRVEIVSSVSASDFSGSTTNPGVLHLRRYLDFAERGISALSLEVSAEELDTESPFEEEVARVIRSWGYDVVPQVGQAGYRIDLGLRHPSEPGRFILGIECDGAMYHSSKVARDRDRLRQEVLEKLGWNLYRIWGTSWYRDRASAEQRLRDAIEAAVEGRIARKPVGPATTIDITYEEAHLDGAPTWTQPYEVARPIIPASGLDMAHHLATSILSEAIMTVIRCESPVHEEVVLRRVREAWGVGRAGSRIREVFSQEITRLARTNSLQRDRLGFLSDANNSGVASVRVPTEEDSRTARKIDEVPLEELALAIRNVVVGARAINQHELIRIVARIFGWSRTGDGILGRLEHVVKALTAAKALELSSDGTVRIANA